MEIELEKIRLDGGTQPRSQLLLEVMEDYAEQMLNGVEFPPITVFFDGKEYWLADGFHRVGAARRVNPSGTIAAEVRQGTQSDAQWHSFGVNKTHGLRRTNDDKERVVRAALRHPNAAEMSNVRVAEHCGVHEKTVRRYRGGDGASSEMPKMRTVSRGGATYRQDATHIGRSAPRGPGARRRKNGRANHKCHKAVLASSLLEKMTAVTLPHNPVMGAMTLIEVFDADYLRVLVEEVSRHLKGLPARAS